MVWLSPHVGIAAEAKMHCGNDNYALFILMHCSCNSTTQFSFLNDALISLLTYTMSPLQVNGCLFILITGFHKAHGNW